LCIQSVVYLNIHDVWGEPLDTVSGVALLIPESLDLGNLFPESERRVIQILLKALDADWHIIPKVGVLVDNANAEIDLVLASRHRGVFVLEVKGGTIAVRDGQWYSNHIKLKTDPFSQIANAKHQLVRRLKAINLDLTDLFFNEIVVLPDVGDVPSEGLGPNAPRSHCWTSQELKAPEAALAFINRENKPVPVDRYLRFLRALCQNIELNQVEGRYVQGTLRKLDDATRSHLDVLVRAGDTNVRFLVTGAAGTGKTYLAERWARRCATRGERTLLVCYNVPISQDIATRLDDTDIVVSNFHSFAEQILKPVGFTVPKSPTSNWWETVPAEQIIEQSNRINERFDAIIIDEAQDFRPLWIEALETLFKADGPHRLLMLADPEQAIYGSSWTPPRDMPSLELVTNLRSTRVIARHLRNIGGATPNPQAPEGAPIAVKTATAETLVARVSEELLRLREEYDIPPSQTAILTRHTQERDLLLSAKLPLRLVRWDERDEESVVCETIHRTKGLERLAIIYVDIDSSRDKRLEYVGSGRAIAHLVSIVAATGQ
jgi:hypothetical protein